MADRFVFYSAAAVGSRHCRPAASPHNPQGILRIRRIREVQFMLPEFVDRMRGSNRQSAQPTGSRWNRALPGGGSSWQSALPTGSQWVQAQPARLSLPSRLS